MCPRLAGRELPVAFVEPQVGVDRGVRELGLQQRQGGVGDVGAQLGEQREQVRLACVLVRRAGGHHEGNDADAVEPARAVQVQERLEQPGVGALVDGRRDDEQAGSRHRAQGDEELNAVEKDYIVRSANFPSINTKTDNNVLKTVDNLGNTAIASLNGNILRIIVFDNQNTVKWQNQTTLTTPYVHKLNNLTFFDEQNIEIVVNNTENNSNAGSEKLVYNLDTSQSGDVYSVYNLADHVVEQQPVYSMNNKRISGLTATQRFKIGNNNYYIIAQDDTQYVSKYSSVIPRKFYIYREISGILDPIKYLFRSSAPKNKLVYELTKVDIDEGYLFIENLVNANLSKYYSLKNVPNMPVLSNSVSLKLAPKIKSQDTEYDIKVSELQSAVSE